MRELFCFRKWGLMYIYKTKDFRVTLIHCVVVSFDIKKLAVVIYHSKSVRLRLKQ